MKMRKIIISLIFAILFVSFVSAETIITKQPENLYNLGDIINLPVKITSLTDINKLFTMNLICNGIETEVYKEFISLSAGEEKQRNPAIPLIKSFAGKSTGTCKIKIQLGEEPVLTNEFQISDFINIELKTEKTEFAPEESIVIEGEAKREDGKLVEGIIEVKVIDDGSEAIKISDTVNNGYFFLNFSLSKDAKAGQYLASINVYEKDSEGEITNKGFVDYNILITQLPTILEIAFENQ